jgi:peptidoglycan/LPS O-acetylase OafA/YrhL
MAATDVRSADSTEKSSRHIASLDSLRGLAAMVVVFSHLLNLYPEFADPKTAPSELQRLIYSPLHLLWAGHEAVVLFFALSGFVLASAMERSRSDRLFLLRRCFRILPAYWVSLLAAFLLSQALAPPDLKLSSWFDPIWQDATITQLALHLPLVGFYNVNALVPPVWSLTHELRISLIFPWLHRILVQGKLASRIAFGFAVYVIGVLLWFGARRMQLEWARDLSETLIWTSAFVAGALLYRTRERWQPWLQRQDRFVALWLVCASLLCTWRWWFLPFQGGLHGLGDIPFQLAGATLFILFAMGANGFRRMLEARPLVWLGEASYSIYLWHCVILVALAHALFRLGWRVDDIRTGTVIGTLALTPILSRASYRWIEKPAMAMGRRLGQPRTSSSLSPESKAGSSGMGG